MEGIDRIEREEEGKIEMIDRAVEVTFNQKYRG